MPEEVALRVTVPARQDIGAYFQEFSETELRRAADRFGIVLPGSFTTKKSDRIERLLDEQGLAPTVVKMFNYVLSSVPANETQRSAVEKAFRRSPLRPVVRDGQIGLVLEDKPVEVEEDAFGLIEEYAPDICRQRLEEAQRHVAEGNNWEAVTACRLAIDALMVGSSYVESLDEMRKMGLLTSVGGGSNTNVYDVQLIKALHKWLGSTGPHNEHGRPETSPHQARLAVGMTMDAVRFLLVVILDAQRQGLSLVKWVNIGN